MPTIQLTQGKSTVVGQLDYAYLNHWKWRFEKSRNNSGYAIRYSAGTHETRKIIRMHNIVAKRKGIGTRPDHKNTDKLDNRRGNLRPATRSQQGGNRPRQSNNKSSKYKGVTWHKVGRKWQAHIRVEGRFTYLGLWAVEEDAARAYSRAAIKAWPKHAYLNPVTPRF